MGLSGIVCIATSSHESKVGSGDEDTYETVVARKGDQFAMISVHERAKFGSSAGRRFKVSSEASISESEYQRLSKGEDLVDTAERLEGLTQDEQRAARLKNLDHQLDELAPKCPGCGRTMKRKYGKHGSFWGCPRYPKCRITANLSPAALQIVDELKHV
jgi:hypothetical protein